MLSEATRKLPEGLRGFISSRPADPRDLAEIPSDQRCSRKVQDTFLQSKNKEAFLFLYRLVFWRLSRSDLWLVSDSWGTALSPLQDIQSQLLRRVGRGEAAGRGRKGPRAESRSAARPALLWSRAPRKAVPGPLFTSVYRTRSKHTAVWSSLAGGLVAAASSEVEGAARRRTGLCKRTRRNERNHISFLKKKIEKALILSIPQGSL